MVIGFTRNPQISWDPANPDYYDALGTTMHLYANGENTSEIVQLYQRAGARTTRISGLIWEPATIGRGVQTTLSRLSNMRSASFQIHRTISRSRRTPTLLIRLARPLSDRFDNQIAGTLWISGVWLSSA
jgi:hypothetical protein